MPPTLRESILAYTSARTAGPNGVYRTEIPGLALIRGDRHTPIEHVLYDPAVIVVVQGAKELMLGDTRFRYGAGQYMLLSVGLPVLASITEAEPERPYLAAALTIDLHMINDLIDELGRAPYTASTASGLGLFVGTLDANQLDGFTRLAALLPVPGAIRVLYPSIAREIFYWLLAGRDGAELRRIATPASHTQRIADAINTMRAELSETVPIERLAAIAHMSPSSFHQHFKAVTAMSPLQYQKQLRLLEARRMMIADGADATRAAYHVGYESPSQFSREYARMFGAPPRRDISGFRAAAAS